MPPAYVIQVGVVLVLLVVCVVYWWGAEAARAQRAELQSVRARCGAPQDNATIFVLVVTRGPDQAVAAARVLHSAFDRAACPFRVFVGVHETYERTPSRSVHELYAQLAPAGRLGRSFADQVTVLRTPPHRARGVHAARAELMARAYSGQAFVCVLADTVELTPAWDARAVAALGACRDPHAILVAPPAETPVALFSAGASAAASAPTAPAALKPRFPVLARFSKAGLPVPGSRAFGRPGSGDPVPALFWMADCAFGPARAYVEHGVGVDPTVPPFAAPFDETLAHLTTGEDGLVSARLWTSGWSFYAPQFTLAAFQAGYSGGVAATLNEHKAAALADPRKRRQAEASHEAVRLLMGGQLAPGDAPRLLYARGLGSLRTLGEWEAFCGLQLARRFIAGRARMGATPTPDANEVRAKYDSFQSYDAERATYS